MLSILCDRSLRNIIWWLWIVEFAKLSANVVIHDDTELWWQVNIGNITAPVASISLSSRLSSSREESMIMYAFHANMPILMKCLLGWEIKIKLLFNGFYTQMVLEKFVDGPLVGNRIFCQMNQKTPRRRSWYSRCDWWKREIQSIIARVWSLSKRKNSKKPLDLQK